MDDEEMIRELAGEMLEELGYTAVTCADGAEAVALYREYCEKGTPFAVVILDMTVPGGMGGKDAAVLIRDFDPEAVLIISTGYTIDASDAMEKDSLFRGMVSKPYNVRQLALELDRLASHGASDGR